MLSGKREVTVDTVAQVLSALQDSVNQGYQSYLEAQPRPFKEDRVLKRNETLKIDNKERTCQVALRLTSVSRQDAIFQLDGRSCGAKEIREFVLDKGQRKTVPGTNEDLMFSLPDNWRPWPLQTQGAVISLF